LRECRTGDDEDVAFGPELGHGESLAAFGMLGVEEAVKEIFAVDTVNIYFRAPEPINIEQATKSVKLAGCPGLDQFEVLEMQSFPNPTGFTFSVTMALPTGATKRVGFYALKLEPNTFPRIGDHLTTFFSEAPSYDPKGMNAIAWSFGNDGKRYIKAEGSYCGRLVPLMREWNRCADYCTMIRGSCLSLEELYRVSILLIDSNIYSHLFSFPKINQGHATWGVRRRQFQADSKPSRDS
jgi:hypothetical protein